MEEVLEPIVLPTDHDADWDHLLPYDDWAEVVVEAERVYAERLAEEMEFGGAEGLPPGITPRRVSVPDSHNKNSGAVTRRQLYVIHTAECPLRVGYAQSLTGWGNGGYQPRASWQKFIDPATVVSWIPLALAAWHAAPANRVSVGYEQSGYARYTRSQWLVPDGLRQMDLLAQEIVRDGIPQSGLRWLTTAQVQAIYNGRDTTTYGLCTHAQISPSTRTDPGAGYPKDVLLEWIKYYHPKHLNIPPKEAEEATMLTLLLTRGSTGAQVKLLQTMLNGLRKAGLDTDGKFGPATETAVKVYQKAKKLDVDGRVGPATRTALNKDWKAHNAPKPSGKLTAAQTKMLKDIQANATTLLKELS